MISMSMLVSKIDKARDLKFRLSQKVVFFQKLEMLSFGTIPPRLSYYQAKEMFGEIERE
jgi:hypothetical protein